MAFAYYVMDCWERERSGGQFEDQDKFLKQCRKWWTAVPTVYRREYWGREQEYKRLELHAIITSSSSFLLISGKLNSRRLGVVPVLGLTKKMFHLGR